jgi:hypothetical protein
MLKNEISDNAKRCILIKLLLKASMVLTDLKDDKNKNIILDIADNYCEIAKKEYLESLDKDVIDIIDGVKNEINA